MQLYYKKVSKDEHIQKNLKFFNAIVSMYLFFAVVNKGGVQTMGLIAFY
jgi:hypothetical protein